MSVTFDPYQGRAIFGSCVVPLLRGQRGGEVRVGGADGPLLRALSFGERSQCVEIALSASSPRARLATLVLELATVEPGATDSLVAQISALHLAGASAEAHAAPFAETVLHVGQLGGWTLSALLDAPAQMVDAIAAKARGEARAGWTRIVLADAPQELLEIRAALADDLLRRGATASSAEADGPGIDRERSDVSPSVSARRGGDTVTTDPKPAPSLSSATLAAPVGSDAQRSPSAAAVGSREADARPLTSTAAVPYRVARRGIGSSSEPIRGWTSADSSMVEGNSTPARQAPSGPRARLRIAAPVRSVPAALVPAEIRESAPAVQLAPAGIELRGGIVEASTTPSVLGNRALALHPERQPQPSAATGPLAHDAQDSSELAELLAEALDLESDLRGLAP